MGAAVASAQDWSLLLRNRSCAWHVVRLVVSTSCTLSSSSSHVLRVARWRAGIMMTMSDVHHEYVVAVRNEPRMHYDRYTAMLVVPCIQSQDWPGGVPAQTRMTVRGKLHGRHQHLQTLATSKTTDKLACLSIPHSRQQSAHSYTRRSRDICKHDRLPKALVRRSHVYRNDACKADASSHEEHL